MRLCFEGGARGGTRCHAAQVSSITQADVVAWVSSMRSEELSLSRRTRAAHRL